MKIVRGYGRSIVGKFADGEGAAEEDLKIRKLHTTKGDEDLSFTAFAGTEGEFILAVWISVIDKIIAKATKDEKAQADKNAWAEELRQKIGAAAWQKILRANRLELAKMWNWKINAKASGKQGNNFPQGNWYPAFLGNAAPERLSDEQITELVHDIDTHIHKAMRQIRGDERKGKSRPHSEGLLADIVAAVGQNTLKVAYEKQFPEDKKRDCAFSEEEWQDYRDAANKAVGGDFVAGLKKAVLDKENKDKPYHKAIDYLKNTVWPKVFCDESGAVLGRKNATEQMPKPLTVHDAITAYYKKLLKDRGSIAGYKVREKGEAYQKATSIKRQGEKAPAKLEQLLPASVNKLKWILCKQHKNRDVNHYIRLGKVLHYTASQFSNENQDSAAYIIGNWDRAVAALPTSPYWTSEGQTQIKQNEAFIRVWRRVLAFAVHSLKNWADPDNTVTGDPTITATWTAIKKAYGWVDKGEDKNEDKAKAYFEGAFIERYELLFGNTRPKEEKSDEKEIEIKKISQQDKQVILDRLRWHIGNLRRAGFHFKGMETFIESLENQDPKKPEKEVIKLPKHMRDFYKADRKTYRAKPLKIMQGAQFERFFTKEQIEEMLTAAQEWDAVSVTAPKGDDGQQLPLPTLRRLLGRVKKTWSEDGQDNIALPPYDSAAKKNEKADEEEESEKRAKKTESAEDKKEKARHAQYIAIKQLYELPFRAWLAEDLSPDTVNTYIGKAVERATAAAQENETDEEVKSCIVARAASLPRLQAGERIDRFFYNLMAETASEMRVQKDYSSDGEQAKKQAAYIEKLKCDVVAYALADYLRDEFKYLVPSEAKGGAEEAYLLKERTDSAAAQDKEKTKAFWDAIEKDEEDKQKKEQSEWDKLTEEGKFLPWLYFLLHLAPVEEVASLRQQIRKWQIVVTKLENDKAGNEDSGEQKAGKRTEVAKIRPLLCALNLYIELHDEQFNQAGQEVPSLSDEDKKQLEGYYAVDFDAIFKGQKQGEKLQAVRGWREMRRFGGDTALDTILHEWDHKISQNHINAWKDTSGDTIAEAQKTRKKLHKEWVKEKEKGNTLSDKEKKNYAVALETIIKHSEAVAQIELHNHLNLHKLLLAVLGRLVDFSGLFERDLYFTMLALFYEKQQRENFISDRDWFAKQFTDIVEVTFAAPLEEKQAVGSSSLEQGLIVEAFCALCDTDIKNRLTEIFGVTGKEEGSTKKEKIRNLHNTDLTRWIRNRFAHLAVLENKNLDKNIDVTRELNFARALMAYDRKLKNAVAKSITEMLARQKLEILWQMGQEKNDPDSVDSNNPVDVAIAERKIKVTSRHYLHGAKVEPRIIHHLGDNKAKDLQENLQNAEFTSMVQMLFGGGNKIKAAGEAKEKAEAERRKRQEAAKKQGKKSGVVRFFDIKKNNGRIIPDEGERDIFVHISDVRASGLKTLKKGQWVSYKVQTGDKGPKAVNLSII